MSKPIIWSYGGGVQTSAIAVLVRQGRLPKPDRIVMADTGWEFKKTWEYTEMYVAPMLAEIGLKIEIAPHSLSKVDLYSHKGEVLIPAFTENAKLPTFCSSEWKMLVVRRYLRSVGVKWCVMWMGMSIDEIQRLKHSSVQWIENYWPLCFDMKMTRGDCVQLVKDYGLPEPIKSRCKMCPHQSDSEWIEVQNESDEWKEAIKIDERIYASHQVRLHKSGKPLSEVQFIAKNVEEGGLFDACDSGFCWT